MRFYYIILLLIFALPGLGFYEDKDPIYIEVEELKEAPKELYENLLCPITKIQQNEIVYSTSQKRPLLATDSAGPCVILGVRHRTTGAGFLAHIHNYAEIDLSHASGRQVMRKLKRLMPKAGDRIQKNENDVMDVFLFGGWPGCSSWIVQSVNNFISVVGEKVKPIGEIYYKPQECSRQGASLLLDMKTGEFFQYQHHKDIFGRRLNTTKGIILSFTSCIFSWLHEMPIARPGEYVGFTEEQLLQLAQLHQD